MDEHSIDPEISSKVVMVRYGELFLKSEPVKHRFINLLERNIRKALEVDGISCRILAPRGRILIYGSEPDRIAGIASRLFGAVDVSVCTITSNHLMDICDTAVSLTSSHVTPGISFAVRARRRGVPEYTSQELGAVVGDAILREFPSMKVDLTHPDYEIFVEAREYGGLVCSERISAPGGLPWGSQGRVISLLSAGIDSPVASWLMMKRGCEVIHLHMDGGRWSGSGVVPGAMENHRVISEWCRGFPVIMVNLSAESFYDAMAEKIHPRYRCVLCKRFMLHAGCRLLSEHDSHALVTGENLGQVASQTLQNLAVISRASTAPVIRPLVTYDKDEIIALARKIGTYAEPGADISCKAVPKTPSTAAAFSDIAACEDKIAIDKLIDEVVASPRYVTALNGEIVSIEE